MRDEASLIDVLIVIGVLPERGVLRRLCLAFGGAWRKFLPNANSDDIAGEKGKVPVAYAQ